MASPIETLKNSLFGQLKSYGDAVQDAFEQRIARPLLAMKRDFNRPPSTTRASSDRDAVLSSEQPTFISYQESVLASTPLEIIDIENPDSLKTLLDKCKSAFSSSAKQRTSEDLSIDETRLPSREQRHSSISAPSTRTHRRIQLRHKSVSFAEQQLSPTADSAAQQNELLPTFTDKIKTHILSTCDDEKTDFHRDLYQLIRPRRISIGNGRDLVYQDLAAEIVGYVLKHALRAVEEEDDELLLVENHRNEQDEELIDLK